MIFFLLQKNVKLSFILPMGIFASIIQVEIFLNFYFADYLTETADNIAETLRMILNGIICPKRILKC